MSERTPRVFVGSSSEAVHISKYLQLELESALDVEVTVWTQGVFEAGVYTLERLVEIADTTDFAVLVATPDDTVAKDDRSARLVPRDNVIFELGLFIGALGRHRTYIVADRTAGEVSLPSDLAGLTWLPYRRRSDGNESAAVNAVVLRLVELIRKHGPR